MKMKKWVGDNSIFYNYWRKIFEKKKKNVSFLIVFHWIAFALEQLSNWWFEI